MQVHALRGKPEISIRKGIMREIWIEKGGLQKKLQS